MGHKPNFQGGNGRQMPEPQFAILSALGDGWCAEHPVPTGRTGGGWPRCYKIDIANPELMIALEIDGGSHAAIRVQESDRKKDLFLNGLGWTVLRLSNQTVRDWMNTGAVTDASSYTIFKQIGIIRSL